ncbi:hypothetical protein GCM10010103_69910 [Streptomyces paradoxus]
MRAAYIRSPFLTFCQWRGCCPGALLAVWGLWKSETRVRGEWPGVARDLWTASDSPSVNSHLPRRAKEERTNRASFFGGMTSVCHMRGKEPSQCPPPTPLDLRIPRPAGIRGNPMNHSPLR